MEQSTVKIKVTRLWRDFAARYVSVVFAWQTIVYITITGILLLIPAEFFYYQWATDTSPGVHTTKRTAIGITDVEIDQAKTRIDSMRSDYESAKAARFDIPEPTRATPAAAPIPTPVHGSSTVATTTTATTTSSVSPTTNRAQ